MLVIFPKKRQEVATKSIKPRRKDGGEKEKKKKLTLCDKSPNTIQQSFFLFFFPLPCMPHAHGLLSLVGLPPKATNRWSSLTSQPPSFFVLLNLWIFEVNFKFFFIFLHMYLISLLDCWDWWIYLCLNWYLKMINDWFWDYWDNYTKLRLCCGQYEIKVRMI